MNMKRVSLVPVGLLLTWFFLANQYINSTPIGSFQIGPFRGLPSCHAQRSRYISGLMTNNDPLITIQPGPCYSVNGFVEVDSQHVESPDGHLLSKSAAP